MPVSQRAVVWLPIAKAKRPLKNTLTQDEINRLIVKKPKKENRSQIKWRRSFLFGRGREEASELSQTKSLLRYPRSIQRHSCAGYAGIPLTHGIYPSSIGIFTGHEDQVKSSRIDWEKISTDLGTQVFLMGVENLSFIVKNLIACGGENQLFAVLSRREPL